jgi:hypothetical protein
VHIQSKHQTQQWLVPHNQACVPLQGGALFLYNTQQFPSQLQASATLPSFAQLLIYFLHPHALPVHPTTTLIGVLPGQQLPVAVLQTMCKVWVAVVSGNTQWPSAVKRELLGAMHKMLVGLAGATYAQQHRTALYIPEAMAVEQHSTQDQQQQVLGSVVLDVSLTAAHAA